jgi:DNA replication protein DnaC
MNVPLRASGARTRRTCIAGHHVLYTSAHDMLTQLRASRADDSVDRRMLRFVSPNLLIIDDLARISHHG